MEFHVLTSKENEVIRLRTITETDIESLRKWKNKNRQSFFFQDIISIEMQKQWFDEYLADDKGYMYVIEECIGREYHHPIGCLGYRELSIGKIDLYNVIRGEESLVNQTITDGMHILVNYLWQKYQDITCKVLKSNPSIHWYIHAGFIFIDEFNDYILISPAKDRIKKLTVERHI